MCWDRGQVQSQTVGGIHCFPEGQKGQIWLRGKPWMDVSRVSVGAPSSCTSNKNGQLIILYTVLHGYPWGADSGFCTYRNPWMLIYYICEHILLYEHMQCAHISLSICYIKHVLLGIIHTCYLFVSVVYLPPHFEPPLDCSELPMQCFSARLMVVTLLRQCQHRLLFAKFLTSSWIQSTERVLVIMVRGPAINSKLKLPSGKLDSSPLPVSQEALFDPMVWLRSVLSSVTSDRRLPWGHKESTLVSTWSHAYSSWS